MSSIAIPAIGTGGLGLPRQLVAKMMYEEAIRFSTANPTTTLKEIYFVVYDKDDKTIAVSFLITRNKFYQIRNLYSIFVILFLSVDIFNIFILNSIYAIIEFSIHLEGGVADDVVFKARNQVAWVSIRVNLILEYSTIPLRLSVTVSLKFLPF